MKFHSYLGNKKIQIDLDSPIDISIPLTFSSNSLKAWGVPPAQKVPVKIGSWVGSVKEGGGVNFNNIHFNPHAHMTHSECVGHINRPETSINSCQNRFFFFSKLISIQPDKRGDDLVISKKLIAEKINSQYEFNALIIRTLPNDFNKRNKDYTNQNPPYLTEKCILYLKDLGVNHLLIDLPSIDKEKDDGALRNHKVFFDYSFGGNQNTITELVYIPNEVLDANYFLNLQFMPIENDAAPSRPLLFKIEYI